MEDTLSRMFNDIVGRLDGPLHFRFFLQPTMAIIFATRDGLRDAKANRPAYFWALFTDSNHRREMLRNGWKSVSKVFIIALVLDVVYQVIVLRWVYPVESLIVAASLALVPYLLVRGPVNRIKSLLSKSPTPAAKEPILRAVGGDQPGSKP